MSRPDVLPQSSGEMNDRPPDSTASLRTKVTRRIMASLAAIFLLFSIIQLDIAPERLPDIIERGAYIVGLMTPPVIDAPESLFGAAIESIQMAVVGTVFGILLSLILAVFAARNVSPLGRLSWTIKMFAGFVRAIPALVWALLFIVAVGLGPAAGILALAINSTGMLVKIYSETIEEIPMGPIEALRATGASRLQIALQGILPSVSGVFIAWSVFRFDINVRYSAVLGIVGAGGIGWEVVRSVNMIQYDAAMGITIVIFLMVLATEVFSRWLQHRSEHATAVM